MSLKEFAEFCCVDFKTVLKHCETRWLSLRRAINRTLDIWDLLLSYFTSHCGIEKPGKVRAIFMLISKLTDPSTHLPDDEMVVIVICPVNASKIK